MPVNIDPNFSIYNLVQRVVGEDTAVMNHRRTMNVISHEIENATLLDGGHTRIFSSFQRMSKFIPQVERYRMIAQRAESVFVFGIPDVRPPEIPNVTYIELSPDDHLSKEWFLVSYGRDFASALATEEITHIDDSDHKRAFKGIWTFEVSLISILETWLTRVVDTRPLMVDESDLNNVSQQQHIAQILRRMEARTHREAVTMEDLQIQQEITDIVEADVRPMATA